MWYILGYDKEEIEEDIITLKKYKNIIMKFGRYMSGQQQHYDPVLRSIFSFRQPVCWKDFLNE